MSYSTSPVPSSCSLVSEESLLSQMGVTKSNRQCGKEFMRQELSGYLGQTPVLWAYRDNYSPLVTNLREGIFRLQETFMSPEQKERHGLERKFEEAERNFTFEQLHRTSYSYGSGYLPQALEKSGEQTPVFRYVAKLPTVSLLPEGKFRKGFVFAGSAARPHDPQTREAISSGNYVVCPSAVETRVQAGKASERSHLIDIDVIIAGTQDWPAKCDQFATDHLRDIAYRAAIDPPRPIDAAPHSDTHVFHCAGTKCKRDGDLMTMSDEARHHILMGNSVICHKIFMEKTILSEGMYKDVGAIVAGSTRVQACTKILLPYLDYMLEESP